MRLPRRRKNRAADRDQRGLGYLPLLRTVGGMNGAGVLGAGAGVAAGAGSDSRADCSRRARAA